MSCYGLFDSTGDLGDFANISGLRDFHAWAATQHPLIANFARDGFTKDPESLAKVLRSTMAPENAETMRRDLLAAAEKAKDVLIVSDGPTVDE